ncbi:choice-of-anchor D domain-containing protein [Argonema antarcticum]|uniref:choice-of-anchor D domain-containing protein n=1 Tax=Argonema antarcticum TaxID=2942763 RepID=UPI002010FB96|nr:choice-of-anchor D domain-containing protein [Argonema antarcticum]MCL1474669.1 choice-of-anchor D domain-containing protein [Argonema antarcticum A004/B2]
MVAFNTTFGKNSIDGSSQADSIFAMEGDDIVFGMEGDDIINGNENSDILNGNRGKDLVRGGQEEDLVRGGKDDDLLYGDKGKDTVYGDLGNDTGYGGVGDDLLVGDRNIGTDFSLDGNDVLYGEEGNDEIIGLGGDDFLYGNQDADIINGNEGNDTVCGGQNDDLVRGGQNNDLLFGDKGNDTVYGDLGNDTGYGGVGDDLLVGDEGINTDFSLDGNDVLYGEEGNDEIIGLGGDDFLYGNQDADIINGNEGNDTVCGGQNDDLVRGGQNNDLLFGDKGNDTVYGDLGDDTAIGGEGDDLLFGDRNIGTDSSLDGNDVLFGGQGNDTICGLGGDDIINGNENSDLLYGNEGQDIIRGGQGKDTIWGGQGNDLLYGDQGNDVLWGDLGADSLSGGSGDDVFVIGRRDDVPGFRTTGGLSINDADYIEDFGDGLDLIGLTGGLTFDDLNIFQGSGENANNTLIQDKGTGEFLVNLKGVNSSTITKANFTYSTIRINSYLQFSQPTYRVREDGRPETLVTVTRTGSLEEAVSAIAFLTDGTAKSPNDYNATPIQVNFAAGETAKTLIIPIVSDSIPEGDETFNIALGFPSNGATVASPKVADVTIVDSNSTSLSNAGTLQFTNPLYGVSEDGTPFSLITVTRTGGSKGAVSAKVIANSGSAIGSPTLASPADYSNNPIPVNWADGDTTTKIIIIPVLDDTTVEGNETVNLILSDPTGGATIGSQNNAILTIVDNDFTQGSGTGKGGTISFTAASYSDNEGNGSTPNKIVANIQRTDGSDGPVSVQVQIDNPPGSATDGSDYINISPITVTFEKGETFRNVSIPIVGDLNVESDETINLKLVNAIGGATLGTQQTATYTIKNDDSTPTINNPEIDVVYGSTTVPDDTGNANFGTTTVGNSVTKSFTVKNLGNANLTLGAINSLPTGFTLVNPFATTTITPNSITSFDVKLDATNIGSYNGIISFANNDGDENPYNFNISGIVNAPTTNTEIQVLDGSTDIVDGTTTPINFGTTTVGIPITRTFTVKNLGNSALNLNGWKLPTGFSIVGTIPGSLDVGSSATFDLRLEANSGGNFQGNLAIGNNDSDENPFDFAIGGTVIPVPPTEPEIQVLDVNTDIVDGTTTALNFGTTPLGVPITKTFTVKNSGGAALNLSNWSVPNGFSFIGTLPGIIGSGGSNTFQVKFDAGKAGTTQGTLTVGNNDSNESPFDFAIAATVSGTPTSKAEIEVLNGGTDIVDGTTTALNFGTTTTGTPITKTFTVKNTGTDQLNLIGWKLPTGFSFVGAVPGIIIPGGVSQFDVRLDAIAAGTSQGDLEIGNNDADENPFNFTIAGTVSGVGKSNPEIEVKDGGTNIVDGTTTPINFGTANVGANLTKTFTINNTSATDVLNLNSWTLPKGFSLVDTIPGTVAAGGTANFTVKVDTTAAGNPNGTILIGNNDADENPFDFAIAATVNGTLPTSDAEIQVLDPQNNNIADGSVTAINFGTTNLGVGITKNFTVKNTGTGVLNLSGWKLPNGFSLLGNIPGSIDPGGLSTFQVRLDAASGGNYNGSLEIGNNDGDGGDGVENPFDFAIAGTVLPLPPPNPEIDVLDGTNSNIDSGTETAINFGTTPVGTSVNQTFTIKNTGTDDLTLGKLNLPTGFSVVTPFGSTTIAPNTSTTFTVQLDAKSAGNYTGTILFPNNDADGGDGVENPFYFPIAGTVQTVPAPEIVVLDASSLTPNIVDGTTTPTDIGSTPLNSPISKPFIVINTGNANLSMSNWELPTGFSFVGITPTTIAPGGSATFNVQLDSKSINTFTGPLKFENNDGDGGDGVENPFDFQIKGTVIPPTVSIKEPQSTSENAGPGNNRLFTVNLNSPAPTGGVTVSFNVGGTATFNADYTQSGAATFSTTNGTVIIPAGQSQADITIVQIDDFLTGEVDETMKLTLTGADQGYVLGTPTVGTWTIMDNDGDGSSGPSTLKGGGGSDKMHGDDNGVDTITTSGGSDIVFWDQRPTGGVIDNVTDFSPTKDQFKFTPANFGNISSLTSGTVTVKGGSPSGTDISGKSLIIFDSSITFANVGEVDTALDTQNGSPTTLTPAFFVYTTSGGRFLGYDPDLSVDGNAVAITQTNSELISADFLFV